MKYKDIEIKNTTLAVFYGLSNQTVANYRNGDVEKKRLYQAMKSFYVESML